MPVVAAQLAAERERTASVLDPEPWHPTIVAVADPAPAQHVRALDDRAALRVAVEIAVIVGIAVVALGEQRRVGRSPGREAVLGQSLPEALFVVVALAIEIEERLRQVYHLRRP